MTHSRTAALAVAVAALLTGCGAAVDKVTESATDKAVEKMIESGTDGEVSVDRDGDSVSIESGDGSIKIDDDGSMVVESEDGTMTIETGTALPDDFPDVPLPEGLAVEAVSHTTDEASGSEIYAVSGRVEVDASELFDAQAAALEAAGFMSDFTNDSTGNGEFYGQSMSSNGDGRQVVLTVLSDDGGSVVQMMITDTVG